MHRTMDLCDQNNRFIYTTKIIKIICLEQVINTKTKGRSKEAAELEEKRCLTEEEDIWKKQLYVRSDLGRLYRGKLDLLFVPFHLFCFGFFLYTYKTLCTSFCFSINTL
jgi:hypothetical protein